MNDLHERDFYGWANAQAALLRSGNLSAADIANIAEEIEGMGKSERRELVSQLRRLFLHLLKWEFQPGRRGRSWRLSVEDSRIQLTEHLGRNPSLAPELTDGIEEAYRRARLKAASETGIALKLFPIVCPWTFEQAMQGVVGPLDED